MSTATDPTGTRRRKSNRETDDFDPKKRAAELLQGNDWTESNLRTFYADIGHPNGDGAVCAEVVVSALPYRRWGDCPLRALKGALSRDLESIVNLATPDNVNFFDRSSQNPFTALAAMVRDESMKTDIRTLRLAIHLAHEAGMALTLVRAMADDISKKLAVPQNNRLRQFASATTR